MHAHDRARGAYPHVISKSLTTNGLTSIYPQRDETGCSPVSPAAACQSFVVQRVPSNNRRRQQQWPTLIVHTLHLRYPQLIHIYIPRTQHNYCHTRVHSYVYLHRAYMATNMFLVFKPSCTHRCLVLSLCVYV